MKSAFIIVIALLFISCGDEESTLSDADINDNTQTLTPTTTTNDDLFEQNSSVIPRESILPTGETTNSAPALVDKLIASSYKTVKHPYKNIQINGADYSIYATLDTEEQGKGRLIGIGNILTPIFWGHESQLGYVYSPDKYIATIQDTKEPGDLFSKFSSLMTVAIIMKFTPANITYVDGQLNYKSTDIECLATIPQEYLIHFYYTNETIGQFRLTCNISSGKLASVEKSTVFYNGEPRAGFEIAIGGLRDQFHFKIPSDCDDYGGINTATIAPPEPCYVLE